MNNPEITEEAIMWSYNKRKMRGANSASRLFTTMLLALCWFAISAGGGVMAAEEAIEAKVTGQDQQVGFRALVMKQAIEYNLAGSAKNEPNQIVHFTLQGDKKRIDSAIETIQEGTKRSSDIKLTTSTATIDPSLKTFTIPGWTSSSRNITTPYNLVFKLRTDDEKISSDKVKAEWRQILESTLDPEDLKKLRPDD